MDKLPRYLNIGSGKDWKKEYLNVDKNCDVNPDLYLDLCNPPQFGGELVPKRFEKFILKKEMFDVILANNVLEHILDLVTAMTFCKDILVPSGIMEIKVPYDLSLGAWQDPTHIRGFNERSFIYYNEWCWYLGWKDYKLVCENMEFGMSAFGKELHEKQTPLKEMLRTPRAVDDIKVILRKVII